MLKILAIFGTRPEAIKMLPVVNELTKHPDRFVCKICVTAQHRQMLDQVLEVFNIKPDYDLNIMKDNQNLNYISSEIFKRLEPIFEQEKPDWILVQGDTTTAMIATITAFHKKIKVGHIEAGLRTWDLNQPYPEEANRKISDMLSTLHFAPTGLSKQNLLKEGIKESSIFITGNTVIDAIHEVLAKTNSHSPSIIESLNLKPNKKLILVTTHRRENFGRPMMEVCAAVKRIARQYLSEIEVVVTVHPNPNVKKIILPMFKKAKVENIKLVPALDYISLVQLMNKSYLILTDSGGIQEEAPGLGKPVLVFRNVTERPEGVDAGVVKMVGTSFKRIVEETARLLDDQTEYEKMAKAVNPYGDGKASERIAKLIYEYEQNSEKIQEEHVEIKNNEIDYEKISIVMPTYNGASHIQKSIESCLNQTYRNTELIIVDDGSIDDIKTVVDKFNDNRIKYFKHNINLGLPAALNTGFEKTTGGYLTWTSDDNFYKPDALEIMVAYLKNHSDVDFVYSDFYIVNEKEKIVENYIPALPETLKKYSCVGASFLYTRKVYEKIGGYDINYFLAEDYDHFLKIYTNFKMAKISKSLYYYRSHSNSLTEKYGDYMVSRVCNEVRLKNFSNHFKLERSLKGRNFAIAVKDYYLAENYKEARKYIAPAILNNLFYCLTYKDKNGDREVLSAMLDLIFGIKSIKKIRFLKRKILEQLGLIKKVSKLVSVVICTKDRLQEVLNCITSILKQSHLPKEIIIVDSSLNNNILLSAIERRFKTELSIKNINFKFYISQSNVAKQSNLGIKNSSGDIVILLDDDVILENNFIKEMLNIFDMKSINKVGAVMGNIINEKRENTFSYRNIIKYLFFMPKYGNGKFRISSMPTTPTGLNKVKAVEFVTRGVTAYNRKVFNEFLFDESLCDIYGAAEDVDFSYRIMKKYTNYYTPYAKCYHYEVSNKDVGSELKRIKYFQNYQYLFYKNIPRAPIRKITFRIALFGLKNRADLLPLPQIMALLMEQLFGNKVTSIVRKYYRKMMLMFKPLVSVK